MDLSSCSFDFINHNSRTWIYHCRIWFIWFELNQLKKLTHLIFFRIGWI